MIYQMIFFTQLKSILNSSIKFIPKPLQPREYQKDMIDETLIHFSNNDRGQIESACGTGKTLTSYWIHKNLDTNLTIVAVPSLFLLSQFYKDWANQMFLEAESAEFILVGSDADCDDIKYENNGLIITTDIETMTNIINDVTQNWYNNDNNKLVFDDKNQFSLSIARKLIIITTYQSSNNLIIALNTCHVEPDLLICDEAHKTVGQTTGKFGLLLDDKNIKIKKRLFVTATPKQFNGNIEEFEVLSMNDETWYGQTIYKYNTSDAIKDNYLTDYQIVTMYTDEIYIQKCN
jgi:predicted helicase